MMDLVDSNSILICIAFEFALFCNKYPGFISPDRFWTCIARVWILKQYDPIHGFRSQFWEHCISYSPDYIV